jgi:hypothetical protein
MLIATTKLAVEINRTSIKDTDSQLMGLLG